MYAIRSYYADQIYKLAEPLLVEAGAGVVLGQHALEGVVVLLDGAHGLVDEGADPLLLVGVNDANLIELQRTTGVRVTLRGDTLTLGGTAEQLERAAPVVQGMLDLARMGEAVTLEDVARLVAASYNFV